LAQVKSASDFGKSRALDTPADELQFDYLKLECDDVLGQKVNVIVDLIPYYPEEQRVSQISRGLPRIGDVDESSCSST
jgi:hypothetical protein